MKKITFLTFTLFFITIASMAQLMKKNQKILGGSFSFDVGNVHDTSSINGKQDGSNFNIYIGPSYGKAIKNNLVLGYSVLLGLNNAKSVESLQIDKTKGYQTGAAVFIEKFYHLGNDFYISALSDININYSYSHYRQFLQGNIAMENKTKSYGGALSFTPSIDYAFNKRLLAQFGLNNFLSLGYHQDKTESNNFVSKTNSKHSQFYFSSALNFSQALSNISIGFRYILD